MYQAKDFSSLLEIEGLSQELLKNHFSLYEGYVKNTNKSLQIMEENVEVDDEKRQYAFGEVKRRFGWEYNGIRLHELYFGNLTSGGSELDSKSDFAQKIEHDFKSFENFKNHLKASAMIRGIGWVLLYYDKEQDKLIITWINEHDVGHLSTATPIMVVDLFEHAYMPDKLKKEKYLQIIFDNLCWQTIAKRFEKAK